MHESFVNLVMVQTKCHDKPASGRVCSVQRDLLHGRPRETWWIRLDSAKKLWMSWTSFAVTDSRYIQALVWLHSHVVYFMKRDNATHISEWQQDSTMWSLHLIFTLQPYGSYLRGCSCRFKVSQKVSWTIPSGTKVRPFCGLYWRCEPTLGRGVAGLVWVRISCRFTRIFHWSSIVGCHVWWCFWIKDETIYVDRWRFFLSAA